jgi:hypothetical protein
MLLPLTREGDLGRAYGGGMGSLGTLTNGQHLLLSVTHHLVLVLVLVLWWSAGRGRGSCP